MGVLQSEKVVAIIGKTLNLVDPRLINHGERVAYMLYKMLKYEGKCSPNRTYELYLAAFLHDIGAYKTDEIDRMVEFETKNVWQHSVYGYLFLKKFSFLGDVADTILYHHLDYRKLSKVSSENIDYAMMLSLADRVDVCYIGDGFSAKDTIYTICGGAQFSPAARELFDRADQKYHILERIKDGSYRTEMAEYINSHVFTDAEIEKCLKMLVYIIDFRSEATVTHTIMTVGFSCEIAKRLKKTKEQISKIYYGSLLHDLGKIATPIAILENPGRLTSEEMAIMKQHVSITEEILDGFIDEEICKIAIRHHEKLDGSGYPHQLKADDLTQCQRAVAVADIMSALSGRRSYKQAYDKDRVTTILLALSADGKICSEIVDLIVTHYDEVMHNVLEANKEVMKVYSDLKVEYAALYDECINL